MRYLVAAILIAFLALVVAFAVQNTQAVTVRLLSVSATLPLALLAVVLYLAGMLTGGSVVSFVRHSISRVRAESRAR
jgi:uncharacterized integral membrane protein